MDLGGLWFVGATCMAPEIIIAELAEPSDARVVVPYGVPRRFGIGTILIVTAAFAGYRN
jgi:hypothetical protein